VTVVQFAVFGNTSWQVEVETEIFVSADNTTGEMLLAVMHNILVLDRQGAYTDSIS
jgi:hypothetical protein